jgi:hypothetical protein
VNLQKSSGLMDFGSSTIIIAQCIPGENEALSDCGQET